MKKLLLLPALLLSWSATAAPPGFLDFYYIPSAELVLTNPARPAEEDGGDGFGIRSMTPISDSAVLTGEYQKTSYDDSGFELKQLRLGLGITGQTGSGILMEYVKKDFELFDGGEADGFAAHGRLAGASTDAVGYYGQVGYVSVKDDSEKNEGLEFSAGISVAISPKTGLLLDFRQTNLKGEDSDIKREFGDFRVGLRFNLWNGAQTGWIRSRRGRAGCLRGAPVALRAPASAQVSRLVQKTP